jgi:hypothetical protein
MSKANSTETTPPSKPSKSTPNLKPGIMARAKPEKPFADFELFPHSSGRWCKKIKGRSYYFGRWDNPEGALRLYKDFLDGKPKNKSRRPGNHQSVKPRKDLPLTAHPSGRWCKKIRGNLNRA